MPLNLNTAVMVLKNETTAGTAVSFDSTDYDLLVKDVEVSPVMNFDDANKYLTGDHGRDLQIKGVESAEVSGTIDLRWGGAVDTAPAFAKLLKSLGCVENTYSTTGIGYSDQKCADSTTSTIRIYMPKIGCNNNALTVTIAGAIGNSATLQVENVAGAWRLAFKFIGRIESVDDTNYSDIPVLDDSNLDSATPERFTNNSVSLLGTTTSISNFSLDFGLEASPVYDQSVGDLSHYVITGKNPILSCNPYAGLVSENDIWNDASSMTEGVTNINTGQTPPHLTLEMPRGQYLPQGFGDVEGLVTWELNIAALRNGSINADIPDESSFELLIGARS